MTNIVVGRMSSEEFTEAWQDKRAVRRLEGAENTFMRPSSVIVEEWLDAGLVLGDRNLMSRFVLLHTMRRASIVMHDCVVTCWSPPSFVQSVRLSRGPSQYHGSAG